MKKENNKKILKDNPRQSATKLGLGERFVLKHDNEPNHKAQTWIQ